MKHTRTTPLYIQGLYFIWQLT